MTMKLEAQWIVGFVDAEGCFVVSVRTAADRQTPIRLQPAFVVTQHKRDIQVLYALKAYFGCGQVYEAHKVGCNEAVWKVQNLEHLMTSIIPFFEKHALKTKKGIEFQRFRRICLRMQAKVHRTSEGLNQCVELARNLRVTPENRIIDSTILNNQSDSV